MKRFLLLLLLPVFLIAGTVYHYGSSQHYHWVGAVPSTSTTVIAGTVYIRSATLTVAAADSDTVTIYDRGTDCGGSPCPLMPTMKLAGDGTSGGVLVVNFGDAVAPGGITIISGSAKANANIHYLTQLIP